MNNDDGWFQYFDALAIGMAIVGIALAIAAIVVGILVINQ